MTPCPLKGASGGRRGDERPGETPHYCSSPSVFVLGVRSSSDRWSETSDVLKARDKENLLYFCCAALFIQEL